MKVHKSLCFAVSDFQVCSLSALPLINISCVFLESNASSVLLPPLSCDTCEYKSWYFSGLLLVRDDLFPRSVNELSSIVTLFLLPFVGTAKLCSLHSRTDWVRNWLVILLSHDASVFVILNPVAHATGRDFDSL